MVQADEIAPPTQGWSDWKPFPDPRKRGILEAPFGPGVYELRRKDTKALILVGSGKNCALRMTSILPSPLGQGTRRNEAKRCYVLEHISLIEYRTSAFHDVSAGTRFEDHLRANGSYIFPT